MFSPSRWEIKSLHTKNIPSIQHELHDMSSFLHETSEAIGFTEENCKVIISFIKNIETIECFLYCLSIEEQDPSYLSILQSQISILKSDIRSLVYTWSEMVQQYDTTQNDNELLSYRNLLVNRQNKKQTISEELFITNSTIEVLRGHEEIYKQLQNSSKVIMDGQSYTIFQIENIAMKGSHTTQQVNAFQALNEYFNQYSPVYASIYNHMGGLRISHYKQVNSHFLEESLAKNGLSLHALNTMWSTIDRNLPKLTRYIDMKAHEYKKEKISWYELMSNTQEISTTITFQEAITFISKALASIDPSMSKFVLKAIKNSWIDAVPHESKSLSGFCVPFLKNKQSRISLYFDGQIDSARILAHELGHAWHYQQISELTSLSFLEDRFEMTTAETASIFFETAFVDAAIHSSKDPVAKKALLGWKIERSLNYLMSIRGAYEFEKRFNEHRMTGPLTVDTIEKISLQVQEDAYGKTLSSYQPYVWIKYEQFYQAEVPFYNYPYTFGFLLSLGLLKISNNEHFPTQFQRFLRESGTAPVEKLVYKHFHIELTNTIFWQNAIDMIIHDIEQYQLL